jgi:hypothetical protein
LRVVLWLEACQNAEGGWVETIRSRMERQFGRSKSQHSCPDGVSA